MLTGKGLLDPLQREFLSFFASLPDQDQFFLTGGTALAEYYLGHRLSYDLDFFTGQAGLVLPMSFQIEQQGAGLGFDITVVRRFATYVEFSVARNEARLKVDLALDSPFRFEAPLRSEHGNGGGGTEWGNATTGANGDATFYLICGDYGYRVDKNGVLGAKVAFAVQPPGPWGDDQVLTWAAALSSQNRAVAARLRAAD